jgi:LAS superfamily LD-carboxypeptidase LdcB
MNFPSLKKVAAHFLLANIIILFAVSCENCTSTSADNKVKNTTDTTKKSVVVKKDTVSKQYLLGKVIASKDTNFIAIDAKYTSKNNMYLRKDAYKAFVKMHDAALKDGVTLTILSAFRSFNEQKGIWEGKWTGRVLYYGKNIATSYPDPVERSKYVLKYSSMPGTSRHHWGTDMDMNSMELAYYKSEAGKKMYNWLTENASKFGFCQPYTAKDSSRLTGYEEEKWHWSYYPISSVYYEQYQERITYDDLKGFEGFATAKQIDVIKNYVMSVNKKCQ